MTNNKQSSVEKEFIPYEEALALKELGFDEPCFGYHYTLNGKDWKFAEKSEYYRLNDEINIGSKFSLLAPTFSQAFRWFREQYWYTALILCDSFQIVMQLSTSKTLDSKTGEYSPVCITQTYHKEVGLKSYDESELACLKKLIEISNERK